MALEGEETENWFNKALWWVLSSIGLSGAATVLLGLAGKNSETSLYSMMPEFIKDFFDPMIEGIQNWWNGTSEKIAEHTTSEEEKVAKGDIKGRIDRFKGFEDVAERLKLKPDAAEKLREIAQKSAKRVSLSSDSKAALAEGKLLYNEYNSAIFLLQKEAGPESPTEDNIKNYQTAANHAAAYLSGITEEVGENPEYVAAGLTDVFIKFQKAVGAEGDYKAGDAGESRFNKKLVETAVAAAAGQLQAPSTPPSGNTGAENQRAT